MTNEEKAKEIFPDSTGLAPIVNMAIQKKLIEIAEWKDQQLSKQNKWHKVADDKVGSPLQDYDGQDWVLCQFQDYRDGFLYMPHIAEWNRTNKCWHTIESDNWESVYSVLGKCIAWHELPKYNEQ